MTHFKAPNMTLITAHEHSCHLMKTTYLLLAVSLLALTGCSTTHHSSAKADSETVLVTYHIKPGTEDEFQKVLSRAWEVYRSDHLVFSEPHIVVRDTEAGGKTRVVEVFTWVSRAIPEHAPESVKTVWKQEESLCEKRGGHYGIEPGEVELLVPSRKSACYEFHDA